MACYESSVIHELHLNVEWCRKEQFGSGDYEGRKDGLDMGMIDNDWLEELEAEFQKPYYKELYQFVKEEYNTTQIFPLLPPI